MVWTKIFEDYLTYAYRANIGGMSSGLEIDENLYNQLSEATSVKLSIEGHDPETLPVTTLRNVTTFGEIDISGVPIFDTYGSCLSISFNSRNYPVMAIAFDTDETDEHPELNTIIEIEEGGEKNTGESLVKEYWDKNYPSINWNILPQLFEEEEIELTEEIEEYLKMTPWNTNQAVLKTLLNNEELTPSPTSTIKIFLRETDSRNREIITTKSDLKTPEEIYNYLNSNNPDSTTIQLFDEKNGEDVEQRIQKWHYNEQGPSWNAVLGNLMSVFSFYADHIEFSDGML